MDSTESPGKRTPKGSWIPGLVISLIVAILELGLCILLWKSNMLPQKYLAIGIGVLALLVALIAYLTHRTGKRVRFILGIVLSVILAAVTIYGLVALHHVTSTLNNITGGGSTEVANVGVYTLSDDPAESLNDLAGETFGILSVLDRESTDEVIAQLEESLGVKITIREYDGLTDLIDGLLNQECRCIILNTAYLDLFEEMEGYESVVAQIHMCVGLEVEETIPPASTSGTDATESSAPAADGEISDPVFTLYISGSDSRNGLQSKSRSDVNIIAIVNCQTHQMLLVSTPRDYYVELPISNGAKDKLTHAGIYGINVSMGTLEMLYDIDLDYYLKICFEGVVDIVDALGGVTVYSDYTFSTGEYSFVQGYNEVDGEAALAFVRERHAFPSGDRQRGKNQMALINAMMNAISPEILTQYVSILDSVAGNFDTSLPYSLLSELVKAQLADGEGWEVLSYSVTGSDSYAVPYSMSTSAYVMIPDEASVETAKSLMQGILNGEVISLP